MATPDQGFTTYDAPNSGAMHQRRSTLSAVVAHQKHAFRSQLRDWSSGELVLVSKNRADCAPGEKQIQYVMRLRNVRPLRPGEVGRYWPGNEGRWEYLLECSDTHRLRSPFNLREVIGEAANHYRSVETFAKIAQADEY